jgi:hypothetical protein
MESPMTPLFRLVALFVISFATQADGAGRPEALKGKSIILTWTEVRQQRVVGEPDFHTVNGSVSVTLYISTAGRIFSRRTDSVRGRSGSRERAPDDAGVRTRGGHFRDQTLTLISESKGGASRIAIEFDESFASCGARVAVAFQSGKTAIITLSPIIHKYIEIKSVAVNGVNCAVNAGNALAGAT